MVGDLVDLGDAVLGDDDADAGVARKRGEERDDIAPRVRVQVGERLVDEQQDRVLDDRRGDGDLRRLAGRQPAQRPVEKVRDAAPLADLRDACRHDRWRDASKLERQSQFVAHAVGRESFARMLQHDAHELRGVARGNGRAVVAGNPQDAVDAAAVDVRVQSREGPEQRRLAGAGGSRDDGQRPRREDQVGNPDRAFCAGAAVAQHRIPHLHGCQAVALDGSPGEPAQLERRRDRRRSGESPAQHRSEQSHPTPLASQSLREAHGAHRVGECGQGGPRHRQSARDPVQRASTRAAREHARQIHQGVDQAEGEDRDGDRERAGGGIPQSAGRDRSEKHDVRERRGQRHLGEVEHDRAGAVRAVEQHPVDDPDDNEPGGESRRGAQGSGSKRHRARRSERRVRRSA